MDARERKGASVINPRLEREDGSRSVHGTTSELTLAGEPRVRIHLNRANLPRLSGKGGSSMASTK